MKPWPQELRALRIAVRARDGQRCVWCASVLSLEETTLDHALPRGSGGSWWQGNLLVACHSCNNQRGDMSLTEWAAMARSQGLMVQESVLAAAMERLADPLCHWEAEMLTQGFSPEQVRDVAVYRRDKRLHSRLRHARHRARDLARSAARVLADPPQLGALGDGCRHQPQRGQMVGKAS